MKKMLITGVNPVQCGRAPKMAYITAVQAVLKSFEFSGFSVDIREVVPGESLGEYDQVVVFLAPMTGFICKHTLGAAWAMHAAKRWVMAFDDWQVRTSIGSAKSVVDRWDKLVAEDPFGWNHLQAAKSGGFLEAIKSSIEKIAQGDWAWKSLLCQYPGGDTSMFSIPAEPERVISYNPSIHFKGVYGEATAEQAKEKASQWVLAALHDHGPWVEKQGLANPVKSFGVRKLKQPRLTEKELFQEYLQSTGVLSPPYKKICGSGWWRARYGFAADALCVIAGSTEELSFFGDMYSLTPAEVEALSEPERLGLALWQRDEYYRRAGTQEELAHTLSKALE